MIEEERISKRAADKVARNIESSIFGYCHHHEWKHYIAPSMHIVVCSKCGAREIYKPSGHRMFWAVERESYGSMMNSIKTQSIINSI